MFDFTKLNDPEWQAQARKEREEQEAKAAAHQKVLRSALNVCFIVVEALAQNERSLVRNCEARLNRYELLSDKQEKWLLDIADRVRKELEVKVQALIARHANGDPLGEHPAYPRSNWPKTEEYGAGPRDYWFWVLRLVEVFGDEAPV